MNRWTGANETNNDRMIYAEVSDLVLYCYLLSRYILKKFGNCNMLKMFFSVFDGFSLLVINNGQWPATSICFLLHFILFNDHTISKTVICEHHFCQLSLHGRKRKSFDMFQNRVFVVKFISRMCIYVPGNTQKKADEYKPESEMANLAFFCLRFRSNVKWLCQTVHCSMFK